MSNFNIIKIQSLYRGYKKRKFINNFYKKLPDDVQNIIIYFIKKDFYREKLNKKLDIIISRKIENYLNNFDTRYYLDLEIRFTLVNFIYYHHKEIYHIYYLFNKYRLILSDYSNIYLKLENNLREMNDLLELYESQIFNALTNHIYNIVSVTYKRLYILFI